MSKKDDFKFGVKGIVAVYKVLGKTTVTRTDVSVMWKLAGELSNNTETIPGYDTSDAMEEIAPELNGTFKDDGRDAANRRINPRIEF
jgi:hypothetical protein